MAKVDWPLAGKRLHIGKRYDRVDGPQKSTGAAKYSYDINRPGMLWAKLITSTHAKAEIVSVDSSAAEKMPGVKAYWKDEELKDVQYQGQIIACIAAESEEMANDAARAVKVEYKKLDHQVVDSDPQFSKDRASNKTTGNFDDAFGKAEVTHAGEYGCPVITHCCLEPHGQVTEMQGAELMIWPSTQNVSKYSDRLGEAVGVDQNKIKVDCQYMGGGFGSKFNFDQWGKIGGILAKQSGRPVKLLLERDIELMTGGNRPSAYAKIKVGASKDGTLTAMESEVWGTSGIGGAIPLVMPYVFTKIPNTRTIGKRIQTNRGSARAWRAPNHPQNCFLTMSALADTAAALKMDELDFFLHNCKLTDRAAVYEEELKIAADIIGYKQKAHLRGANKSGGPVRRGLGVSIHTWGGRGHASECDVTIHADGSVETKIGSQDLGTGNRTAIKIVVAETLGVPLDVVDVKLGKSDYPQSGASGGSTTIGGVSVSSRLAATAALNALLETASQRLGVPADALEASNGEIRVTESPAKKLSWKDACGLLGPNVITKRGVNNPNETEKAGLLSQGVGGAQIAEVSVDVETGVVTMEEMVAVQDCGLIIDLKTAESQVYGAMIMGITSALFEEVVYDAKSGRCLNADMEFYRLAGIKDVGKLKVQMMNTPAYEGRGVIGLGEPPAVSPMAAIANAVANAVGVRVPQVPLTPDRVITAMQKGGMLA